MSLSIGIVGLPNVGKSTLFTALTKKSVAIENFPFCTIDPSVGLVRVPDNRLQKLGEFSHSEKVIPTAIEFVDIAGLVEGAAQGEGLGNKFLSHIREVDAIAHVVRIFDDSNVTHVHGDVDPCRDIEVINLELIFADLSTVTKRLENVVRDSRAGKKEAIAEEEVLNKIKQSLEIGKFAAETSLPSKEVEIVKQLQLLTFKPVMYILNKKCDGFNFDEQNDPRYEKLLDLLHGKKSVLVDVGIEHELRDTHVDEKQTLRREFGVLDNGIDALIRAGYSLLDLITFFTTGEKETRAWTVTRGATAPEAGAAIHSDFQDKFIRAQTISWDTLLDSGSIAKAREGGLIRAEGKEYIVRDGDVMEFLI
tara:strand:+ start:32900 stop:33991 length:1092 start_codon:yes stop_codon:yes gene_type:complete